MIASRKAVIEMTLGLLVIAGTVQADPTFINTCPVVISSAGRYLLANDLICSVGGSLGAIDCLKRRDSGARRTQYNCWRESWPSRRY
jgi:hypothetical protein